MAAIAEGLAQRLSIAYDGQTAGDLIDEGVDVLLFAGDEFAFDVEDLAARFARRPPAPLFLFAMRSMPFSNWLAAKFAGFTVPWPVTKSYLQALLTRTPVFQPEAGARRETRWRILAPATVYAGRTEIPVLALNVSDHGIMVLCPASLSTDDEVEVTLNYGIRRYHLRGTVRHTSSNRLPAGFGEFAQAYLPPASILAGIKFAPPSVNSAKTLCATIAEERSLMTVRVVGIPVFPDYLDPIFRRYKVRTASYLSVPDRFEAIPQLVITDLSSRTTKELRQLAALCRDAIVIGLVSEPLSPEKAQIVSDTIAALFVLPFHAEDLSRHLESFFAPMEHPFPRFEENFAGMLTLESGEPISAYGINFSHEGCTVTAATRVDPGTRVRGSLILPAAVRAYYFRGETVFCTPARNGFRIGLHIRVDPTSLAGFRNYLNRRFIRTMQARWKFRLSQQEAHG